MKIILNNIGKRYNKEWIFRNINFEFFSGNYYVILGTNGSGKSTLMQILCGAISHTEGDIQYVSASSNETTDQSIFKNLCLAAPYLELPEEMTWKEAVKFHGKFKKYLLRFNEEKVISISGLESAAEKQIKNFSSGMKQRARLTLALLSDTPLLFLDEPSTHLDANGIKWYQDLIQEYSRKKLIIVSSNYNKEEYPFCNKELSLSGYN